METPGRARLLLVEGPAVLGLSEIAEGADPAPYRAALRYLLEALAP